MLSMAKSIVSFSGGKVPKETPKYECWNGCESVKKAFEQNPCGLEIGEVDPEW